MNMNENENNFDSLRRLLKLKRHENPPPGYFNDFSSRVTARIRSEANAGKGTAGRLAVEAPWLMKFLQFFEAKPAFAGGFALALCLLLLGGIVFADRSDVEQSSPVFVDATPTAAVAAPVSVASAAQAAPTLTDSLTQGGGLAVSTNYSLQPVASLFGQSPFAQQVSYTPSGN
jgi:hypothetical protein